MGCWRSQNKFCRFCISWFEALELIQENRKARLRIIPIYKFSTSIVKNKKMKK